MYSYAWAPIARSSPEPTNLYVSRVCDAQSVALGLGYEAEAATRRRGGGGGIETREGRPPQSSK